MDIPIPETWSEVQDRLLPVLRRCTEPASAWALGHSDPSQAIVRRPFAPFLNELVVLDLPDLRLYINRGHLAQWGVQPEDVYRAAHTNLLPAATTGLHLRCDYGAEGRQEPVCLLHLDAEDGYESSRLLLRGWLHAFSSSMKGHPLATVPARGILLVGDSAEDAQVEALLEIAWQAFRSAGGPLSPVLYSTDGGGRVIPWEPTVDTTPSTQTRAGERLLAAYEYSEQREQLLANDPQAAVPPVTLVRTRATGQSHTVCRWSEADGEALLPHTDRVILASENGETEVSWGAIAEHAAGCLEETDHIPTRFRARWPMPKTYRQLTDSS